MEAASTRSLGEMVLLSSVQEKREKIVCVRVCNGITKRKTKTKTDATLIFQLKQLRFD